MSPTVFTVYGLKDAREVIAREIERFAADNGGAPVELEQLVDLATAVRRGR